MQNVAKQKKRRDVNVVGKRDVLSSFAFVEAIYLIFLSQQAEALGLFFDSFVRLPLSLLCLCVFASSENIVLTISKYDFSPEHFNYHFPVYSVSSGFSLRIYPYPVKSSSKAVRIHSDTMYTSTYIFVVLLLVL